MGESKVSVYDGDSVTSSPFREETVKGEVIMVEAEPQELSSLIKPEVSTPESDDKDREHVVVAGVGSALLGMMLCGPILALVFGCGAAYATETNPNVRYRVAEAWTKAQAVDKEHRVVERGVNTIGKGVYWLVEKVAALRKSSGNVTADNSPLSKPTVE